jgi:transcriptional regulator with XRE-family HTH domain
MTIIQLADWLQKELDDREWSGNELATRANIDPSIINRALNRKRMPSNDSLAAIARAFGYPPEQVYRAAGLLPQLPPEDATFEDWKFVLNQLPEEDRQELLEFARLKLKRQQQEQERQRIRKFRPSEG